MAKRLDQNVPRSLKDEHFNMLYLDRKLYQNGRLDRTSKTSINLMSTNTADLELCTSIQLLHAVTGSMAFCTLEGENGTRGFKHYYDEQETIPSNPGLKSTNAGNDREGDVHREHHFSCYSARRAM